MTTLPVTRTVGARKDVEGAIDYYLKEADAGVAARFAAALEAASSLLAHHPHLGSPRYAHALNLPDLRHHRLRGFPWIVFYVVLPDRIEIVRVLDARRDIPAMLRTDDD